MTIRFTPQISAAMIDTMDVSDAFRTGEKLLADRYPRVELIDHRTG